jgi:ATP-dependent DNA ligase
LRPELADVADAREIVLDGEIAVLDDRGVTDIDDLQDVIVGHRQEPE